MNAEEKRIAFNAKQRLRRKLSGNKVTRKYEKTKNGFRMRLYRNMQSRVTGVQRLKSHLYDGKYLLPREEFYKWVDSSKEFDVLFKKWEDSGYDRKLCPSVDRIDSSKGYELSNMEFVTHSENSRRGTISRNKMYKHGKCYN